MKAKKKASGYETFDEVKSPRNSYSTLSSIPLIKKLRLSSGYSPSVSGNSSSGDMGQLSSFSSPGYSVYTPRQEDPSSVDFDAWNVVFQQNLKVRRSSDLGVSLTGATGLFSLYRRFVREATDCVRRLVEAVGEGGDALAALERRMGIVELGQMGVAGGLKFRGRGFFFKFARDDKELYGGDHFAVKVAALELRANNQILLALQGLRRGRSDARELNVPMMVMVDYLGYRVLVSACLPLSGQRTLVYGSADGGVTVVNEKRSKFEEAFRPLARKLRLARHVVGESTASVAPVELLGPGDMEGHLVGNEFFVIDAARLFPAEGPFDAMHVLEVTPDLHVSYTLTSFKEYKSLGPPRYRRVRAPLLRAIIDTAEAPEAGEDADPRANPLGPLLGLGPETVRGTVRLLYYWRNMSMFCRLHSNLLLEGEEGEVSSDAFSNFGAGAANSEELDSDVLEVTRKLYTKVVPGLLDKLRRDPGLLLSAQQLPSLLRRHGINQRFLGLIFVMLLAREDPPQQQRLLDMVALQMLARVLKLFYFDALREVARRNRRPSSPPMKEEYSREEDDDDKEGDDEEEGDEDEGDDDDDDDVGDRDGDDEEERKDKEDIEVEEEEEEEVIGKRATAVREEARQRTLQFLNDTFGCSAAADALWSVKLPLFALLKYFPFTGLPAWDARIVFAQLRMAAWRLRGEWRLFEIFQQATGVRLALEPAVVRTRLKQRTSPRPFAGQEVLEVAAVPSEVDLQSSLLPEIEEFLESHARGQLEMALRESESLRALGVAAHHPRVPESLLRCVYRRDIVKETYSAQSAQFAACSLRVAAEAVRYRRRLARAKTMRVVGSLMLTAVGALRRVEQAPMEVVFAVMYSMGAICEAFVEWWTLAEGLYDWVLQGVELLSDSQEHTEAASPLELELHLRLLCLQRRGFVAVFDPLEAEDPVAALRERAACEDPPLEDWRELDVTRHGMLREYWLSEMLRHREKAEELAAVFQLDAEDLIRNRLDRQRRQEEASAAAGSVEEGEEKDEGEEGEGEEEEEEEAEQLTEFDKKIVGIVDQFLRFENLSRYYVSGKGEDLKKVEKLLVSTLKGEISSSEEN